MTSGRSDYGTLLGEVRHYRRPLPGVVLALRADAQGSYGPDAQNVYLGGPTRLRVVDWRALYGQRAVSGNVEARFPLLRGLTLAVPTPWQLPPVSGAIFADGARVWENDEPAELGALGWAVYLGGGFYPALRWNWSWTTRDFRHFDSAIPQHYFSLAYNF